MQQRSPINRVLRASWVTGLLGALLYGTYMRAVTVGAWVTEGQPFGERLLNRTEWVLIGFLVGGFVGVVLGSLWLLFSSTRKKT